MFDRAGAGRLLEPGCVVATGTACVVFLSFLFSFLSSFRFFFVFSFLFRFFFCFLSSQPVHIGTESSAHHGYSL